VFNSNAEAENFFRVVLAAEGGENNTEKIK
jgi:hypothetical protein